MLDTTTEPFNVQSAFAYGTDEMCNRFNSGVDHYGGVKLTDIYTKEQLIELCQSSPTDNNNKNNPDQSDGKNSCSEADAVCGGGNNENPDPNSNPGTDAGKPDASAGPRRPSDISDAGAPAGAPDPSDNTTNNAGEINP